MPFTGISMFLQGMMIPVFTVGVPLFMMLTGYLNIHKTPTKKYYKGMIRVLVAYLFFSVVTIAFRKYYLGEELSIVQWILKGYRLLVSGCPAPTGLTITDYR